MNQRFLKFLIVGGVNTVFGYSIYCICIYIGIHYFLSLLISTILGVLFNYRTIGSFVFQDKNKGAFLKFVLVYCIVYMINAICLSFVLLKGMGYYAGAGVLTIPIAILTYLLNSKFVFK